MFPVQSLSRVRLFATPRIAARQASLSTINSRSSLKLTSIESVMPSSHLILCCPLFFLPQSLHPSQHQSLFQLAIQFSSVQSLGNTNQNHRCHFTPIRMAKTKKKMISVGGRCGETKILQHCWWKWKWSRSVMSDSLRPMDCSPPGSSVHGILQARILEWIAISFYRGSSRARDQTQVSSIAGRRFNLWATREAQHSW